MVEKWKDDMSLNHYRCYTPTVPFLYDMQTLYIWGGSGCILLSIVYIHDDCVNEKNEPLIVTAVTMQWAFAECKKRLETKRISAIAFCPMNIWYVSNVQHPQHPDQTLMTVAAVPKPF